MTSPPPSDTSTRPRRLPAADLLRAVAVIGVVCVHAAHWPATDTQQRADLWNGVKLAARFSVPVFVVLTGVLMAYTASADRGAAGFLTRRARRSLLPWLAWAPVYFIAGWTVTNDITHSAFGAADWWAGGAGHLYFLLLIPQLYLLYLVWPRSTPARLVLAAACLALQTVLQLLRLGGDPSAGAISDVGIWHAFLLAPFWVGYFACGVAAGTLVTRHGAPDRPRLGLAALAAIAPALAFLLVVPVAPGRMADFGTGTGAFLRPTLVPLVLVICAAGLCGGLALMRHSRPLRVVAGALSADALGIYIVQAMVMYAPGHALNALLQGSLAAEVAGFVLLVVATLALSLGASRLVARSRLHWTIGLPRHRNSAPAPASQVTQVRTAA